MCFDNVAKRPYAKSCLHHIGRRFLTYKEYFEFGGELADSSSGFDSIQCWKPDVEHNQVRLQFFGFLNRF